MNTFPRQKKIFYILLLIIAATVTLFETDVLPQGGVTAGYTIEVAALFLTFGLIFMAIKGYSIKMKRAKESDDATLLSTCCRASEIRLALLFVVMMTNIGLFYGTERENMLYCALAGLMAYIYSYPANKSIEQLRSE